MMSLVEVRCESDPMKSHRTTPSVSTMNVDGIAYPEPSLNTPYFLTISPDSSYRIGKVRPSCSTALDACDRSSMLTARSSALRFDIAL